LSPTITANRLSSSSCGWQTDLQGRDANTFSVLLFLGTLMRQSDIQQDNRSAYFIAGQAVVALLEGLTVVSASISGDDDAAYIDITEPVLPGAGALGGGNRKAAESIIRALLAGIAADGKSGAKLDLMDPEFLGEDAVKRATALMRRMTSNPARVLPGVWRGVTEVVSSPRTWAAITAVAEILLRERTVSGRKIAHVIDGAMPSHEVRAPRLRA
jgi:hypothetical protein